MATDQKPITRQTLQFRLIEASRGLRLGVHSAEEVAGARVSDGWLQTSRQSSYHDCPRAVLIGAVQALLNDLDVSISDEAGFYELRDRKA